MGVASRKSPRHKHSTYCAPQDGYCWLSKVACDTQVYLVIILMLNRLSGLDKHPTPVAEGIPFQLITLAVEPVPKNRTAFG